MSEHASKSKHVKNLQIFLKCWQNEILLQKMHDIPTRDVIPYCNRYPRYFEIQIF